VDLIICVGENCHLSGSEVVVTQLQEYLANSPLKDSVTLKGSFCLGKCSEHDQVTLRLGEEVFQVRAEEAARYFRKRIAPRIEAMLAAASTAERTTTAKES
jgi:NADH:ubiquinone oxidoreductase subunit E